MNKLITGIQAETLTPFTYHSLMVQQGTATLPELISDHAIMFGLAASLGMMDASPCLPNKDYRRDVTQMPWRASVFTTDEPRLLPPLVRRLNLTEEAGYRKRIQDVVKKGNLKDYFTTQEVPPGVIFRGALFGYDPFAVTGQDEIIIRIGLHRNGMVRLSKPGRNKGELAIEQVQLNAATAHLFQRELPVARYLLHGIQLSPAMSLAEARDEVLQWV
ncbi:hypothetical protein [Thiothrix nivea]|uniref:Uncharacterized protein n=1 Tax=Thiothrix nivea (strain ATCC 35100 / DSM 5205 / JP2) TaxID=870187 RepID=A0A656H8I3_THINJ|nr:hypothetical protein [Thiothrix nivea]EIJ32871.1 hypothetical protein Thini_0208 [Thiothrix nivea DSM 5205]